MLNSQVKNAENVTYRFIGQILDKKSKKIKRTLLVTGIIVNPILEDNFVTGSLDGIDISGETFFNGKIDENYGIFCFSKKDLKYPNQEVYENLLTEKDVETLRSMRKNKDFFSFNASFDLNNFDKKLHKINNVQKIEDKEQIKKIRKLIRQARKQAK